MWWCPSTRILLLLYCKVANATQVLLRVFHTKHDVERRNYVGQGLNKCNGDPARGLMKLMRDYREPCHNVVVPINPNSSLTLS